MGARCLAFVLVTSGCGFQITGSSAPVTDDGAVVADADVDVGVDASDIDANVMLCGNQVVDTGEECDDANNGANDGCDACAIEPAWVCSSTGCAHVASLMFSPREALASAGSSGGGGAFTHPCAAGMAIVGFEGDSSDNDTDMGRMRAACARITFDANGTAVWSAVQNTPYEATQMSGGLGTKRCPNDSVVVGYVANAGQYLSGLQLMCSQLRWLHGALQIATPMKLTMYGPATRADLPATQCAAGEVTNAFEGKAGSVFDHFNLKCAAMMPVTE